MARNEIDWKDESGSIAFREWDERITVPVYAHDWGFIIPCKSGVFWEQQTDGVMCHHVEIEGVFVPLERPYCENKRHRHKNSEFSKEPRNLLASLQQANYYDRGRKKDKELIYKLWDEIKEVIHFDFEIIKEQSPKNQEGLLWIKLTKFVSGWGHGKWVEKFIGKTLVLIYPNCD